MLADGLMILKGIVFVLATGFAVVGYADPLDHDGKSCCVLDSEWGVVSKTRDLVIQDAPVIAGGSVVRAGDEYFCALLRFTISDEGKAESISVVRFFPNERIIRSAIQSLKAHSFQVPKINEPSYLLLLEMSIDE